ncbi:MAG: Pr6Pr family membrane protein [Ferruginibacter sp.]|nr:Pr6Pr family membrane protein [Ferruginibacter sp.]
MKNLSATARQIFLTTGAALGCFALVLQCYLIILNRTASIPETIIRFFSFFTILTNILVALCFSFLLLKPGTKWGKFFEQPATLTAITVYIVVVGIVYNLILRFLWNPQGLQRIADELLHTIIPLLFIFYWFLFVSKERLKWNSILPWLIYPTIYCIYTLARGAIVGFYPYPFIDVLLLGYYKVVINIAGLVLVFLVISLVLVAIAKLIVKGTAGLNNSAPF